MSTQNPSIFNEVYGPIMVGPSSSHTAGPARIGLMCRRMLPDEPAEIQIYFDQNGAFPPTYRGQGSDYGFIGGILGFEISDETIKRALAIAEERAITCEFIITDLGETRHPNFTRISIVSRSGYQLTVEAASTGGGMFVITRYQGYPLSITGGAHEFLILTPAPEKCAAEIRRIMDSLGLDGRMESLAGPPGAPALVNLKTDRRPEGLQEAIMAATKAEVLYLAPVLPVVKRLMSRQPFTTAAEALAYAAAQGPAEAWRLAVAYESSLSGRDTEEIIGLMGQIAEVMRQSARRALAGGYPQRGFLPPQAALMQRKIEAGEARRLDLGVLNRAMLWSLGVIDYGLCQGLVVAAPTGGSSGVLPGAVISVAEELGLTDREISQALLTGGLVGVFIAGRATFAAEVAACQAEIGSASAMAAAAVAQLLGGSAEECFKAAALALENLLGLICDPVAGFGNVPCVNRNALGAANALISANMVLAGFDPAIPLDEVISALMNVAGLLPADLRCTGRGGLCSTETAKRLCAAGLK